MGHKVHPKAFRIRELGGWSSRWFEGKKFPHYLEEDFRIRELLEKKLSKAGIEKIEIERSSGKISAIVSSARPGLIFGRGGAGIEELKKEIERKIIKEVAGKKPELKLEVREVRNPWTSAALSAQFIAQQLEKRNPFRKTIKQAIAKVMGNREVKGVRIEVAGRLDGAEIARTEWLKKGQLPRQTIRADVDFARATAHCTYGAVGVKVWIYKGEIFEK